MRFIRCIVHVLLVLMLVLFWGCSSDEESLGESVKPSQNITIGDAAFKVALLAKHDVNKDGEISVAEAEAIQYLDLSSEEIASVKGIEYMPNLLRLSIEGRNKVGANGKLSVLDVSKNTKLTELCCAGNRLLELDLTNNAALIKLNCSQNKLTSLSVASCLNLQVLDCSYNELSELDVSANLKLKELYCMHNAQLNEIVVWNGFDESQLHIEKPAAAVIEEKDRETVFTFTTSDTLILQSKQEEGEILFDATGHWSSKVSTNSWLTMTSMQEGEAGTNLAVRFTAAENTEAKQRSTDISFYGIKNKILKTIHIVQKSQEIKKIEIPDTVFKATLVELYDLNGDNEISYEEATYIRYLPVDGSKVSSLKGIEFMPNLERIRAEGDNQDTGKSEGLLKEIDVSHNPKLYSLRCSGNQIAKLDLSHNAALVELSCYLNEITELNVSGCKQLSHLICRNNKLSQLDLSTNSNLVVLICYENQLTELNLSGCSLLDCIWGSTNQLKTLDISENTRLTDLQLDNNPLETLYVWKNFDKSKFSTYSIPHSTQYVEK